MRSIALEKLDILFGTIASEKNLYIPVDHKSGAVYEKWDIGKKLSGSLNTSRSAKDFFFPQTENLMDFRVSGKNIEIVDTRSETEDFVIFGVRACDVRSFDVLDRVFLAEPVDTYYKNRREHGLIMSLACAKPEETCFCGTFGIDPAEPAGDIACCIAGGNLLLDARTEKGSELLSKLDAITENADEAAAKQQKELRMNGLTSTEKASLLLIDAEGGNVVSGLEYKKDGSLSSRALVANADQMHELGHFARKKALDLARDIYGGKIDAYPYEYKKMNPCEYCEYGSVCGFELQLEGCHYRRLSALDKDEVWQEIAREENKQTDKEEREDG